MKTLTVLLAVGLGLMMTPMVSAVAVDLSSPQDGTSLHPADTLELTLSVSNDGEAPDQVIMIMDAEVAAGGPNNIRGINHKPLRVELEAGAVVTESWELVLPYYRDLTPGSYAVTISVQVFSTATGEETSDCITFTLVKP